jgi:hypothetical protein
MRVAYRIYPMLLWLLCLSFWVGGCCYTLLALQSRWTLFLWPIPSALLAWIVSGFAVARFPRIRYVNDLQIDGLGYVHQPLDVIIPFLLQGFLWAAVGCWRH